MAKFYAVQIRLGTITLDDVPVRFAAAVAALLDDAGGEVG